MHPHHIGLRGVSDESIHNLSMQIAAAEYLRRQALALSLQRLQSSRAIWTLTRDIPVLDQALRTKASSNVVAGK